MLTLEYSPKFLRKLKRLPLVVQGRAKEKILLFKHRNNHRQLKVHKLQGHLEGRLAFSIDQKYRIIFRYNSSSDASLLSIDDHDVYKNK